MRSLALVSSLLIGSAAFAQAPIQAPVQDWRFAHPGAMLVGSFRLKAVLDSPLTSALIKEATAKDPSSGIMVGLIRSSIGGVTEVRFSIRDMGRDLGKGQDPDVLMLVTGSFDEAMVAALTGGTPQSKIEARRIDADTVLLGEGQSLDDAVIRLSKPATGLQARALDRSKAIANHDLWIAGTLPEDLPNNPLLPMLGSLRGLALGISMQSDLRIEVALENADAKSAEDLVSLVRRSQVKQPALGAALQASVDGSTARFRFEMPGDQVLLAVQQGMASGVSDSALAAIFGPSPGSERADSERPPTFRSTTPAPVAPKQGTIHIYGLDEGTREIKTEARQ